MTCTHHDYQFKLSTGQDVYRNRLGEYSVEVDHTYLCVPTKAQALEIAQKVSDDDDSFADECKADKVASVAQTDLW